MAGESDPADVVSYVEAQLAARSATGRASALVLLKVREALEAYAEALTERLGSIVPGTPNADAIALSRNIVFQEIRDLHLLMQTAIAEGRAATYGEVDRIWSTATRAIAESEGIPDAALGAVGPGNLHTLGAYERFMTGTPYTYKSALSGHVQSAQEEIHRIVAQGITRGLTSDELARRLRPYVEGASSFYQSFEGAAVPWNDLQKLSRADPENARRLQYNAARIAYTELHNARIEAELQAFAADPLVGAVRWVLSPNRGKTRIPDICDVLAHTDFYGLGRGIYPVTDVPVPPHPWCRCERFPIKRNYAERLQAKASPSLSPQPAIQFGTGAVVLTRANAHRIVRATVSILDATMRHEIRSHLQTLSRIATK